VDSSLLHTNIQYLAGLLEPEPPAPERFGTEAGADDMHKKTVGSGKRRVAEAGFGVIR